MSKKEMFETDNDLRLIVKGGEEFLIDEPCCTSINIMLKNDGHIMTSFLGAHNPEIIRSLEKTLKAYFKEIKKTLKLKQKEAECCGAACDCGDDCNCNHDNCSCGDDCNCTEEKNCGCGGHKHKENKSCHCEHNHDKKDDCCASEHNKSKGCKKPTKTVKSAEPKKENNNKSSKKSTK